MTGSVAAIGTALFFGAQVWIRNYLQSDKFRLWISGEISRKLDAEVTLDSIAWQDSSAAIGTFTATGLEGSPFARLEARDIRATINAGAVWDRVWQVDEVRVARVFMDFSGSAPRRTAPASSGDGGNGGTASSGFFSSFLPNRTVLKGMDIDQLGFVWRNDARSAEARSIAVHVKPSEGNEFFLFSGRGGTLNLSMLPDVPVDLREFEASLQGDEIALDQLTAAANGADITAEGILTTGARPALNLKGTVANLDVAKVIPEDWLKSLKGTAGGNVTLTGDPREFDRLTWRGTAQLSNGVLEGLPLLHVIARKTRNESFIHLFLKVARTDFTRTGDGGWILERMVLDAPGMLRMKGAATAAPDGALRGELLLGIVPGTLRYLAGAEQQVFLPLSQLLVTQSERSLIDSDDAGLLWTRLKLRGTLEHPEEDLADRLSQAWFNATVDEVMNMSLEGAARAAETASKLATDAAGTVLEKAPDVLENGLKTGTDILEKGVDGGLKAIEGLLPGPK